MQQGQKLILINGRFLTQPVTGVQRYAYEIINELIRLKYPRFKFVIAAPNCKDTKFFDLEIIKDNTFLPTFLWQQMKLPLIMRKIKADLLWSPCNIGPLFVKNHIITIHDASVFAGPSWFSFRFRIYYRLFLPLLGYKARHVVTVSEFSKKELIRYGIAKEEKISVIKESVSQAFKPTNQRPLSSPYVLTVGSRDPRKNVSRLIKAWNSLSPEIKKNRKLIIIGMNAKAFSDEGLKLSPDAELVEYKFDKDLSIYYSGADIFVFPSLYEGFGLPPLEAMACGCPVIVSNVASLPEVCGDAAYYVNPYSVESIAEGIQRVLTDKDLRQHLIKKGLERVRLFSWKESARKYLEIFKEVLND